MIRFGYGTDRLVQSMGGGRPFVVRQSREMVGLDSLDVIGVDTRSSIVAGIVEDAGDVKFCSDGGSGSSMIELELVKSVGEGGGGNGYQFVEGFMAGVKWYMASEMVFCLGSLAGNGGYYREEEKLRE